MSTAPQDRPQLSDAQLRTLAYFAIGVASEGSNAGRNVAYQLSFAGNISGNVMTPVGNSGFSIGTLQTDLGQHPEVATQLVDAYQRWARQQQPSLELDARQRQQTVSDLQRDGDGIRAQNGRALDGTVRGHLNTFLASSDGVAFVHAHDVSQVDRLLRHGDGRRDPGGAMQQLRGTDLYQHASLDDQAKLATMLMKLENQAGLSRYPGVLRSIASGDLASVDDVKTRIDGMLPNRVVRGREQPDYLESGVEHALKGTEVFNRLRAAGPGNPMRDVFAGVSADPLVSPVALAADRAHPEALHRYEVVKTLFLQNTEAPAYLDALQHGRSHAWGRPQAARNSPATAGLYASGDDLVIWNRDGRGHAFIDGQWSTVPRAELHRQQNADGSIDLNRAPRNGMPEQLLHVEPAQPERRRAALSDPLLQQAEEAVRRLEDSRAQPFGENAQRLAASSTCLAREAGLTRIDHVVLGASPSQDGRAETLFVVQGDPSDPAHLRAQMPAAQAFATPVDTSLAQLQTMNDAHRQTDARSRQEELDHQSTLSQQARSV
ncbi:XVIPCD domain-containing protein [Stenotrophomonas maltophilia]|uniref:XVIPCD domain-containing protein n=1 Tax=Stenotrophomonas maltophilia TaxID=40324 RepID=UPI002895A5DC|nr:XVIPCD domain-containing protein [Stenotrophomonas maltophilia]MDT3485035.1 hypothetical protein [Stenotrophomonas maltophilia]